MKTNSQSLVEQIARRYGYSEPHWLGTNERLDFSVTTVGDGIKLRANHFREDEPVETWRFSEATITDRELAATMGRDGAIVDLVTQKLDEAVDELAPEPLPDGMANLALQAYQGDDAADVLVDALLEQGAITAQFRRLRTNCPTDAELQEMQRRKALAWARPHVELLFRRNWSSHPWRRSPLEKRYGTTALTTAGRVDQFRDRVRQLADLRDAALIDDEQVTNLINRAMEDIS